MTDLRTRALEAAKAIRERPPKRGPLGLPTARDTKLLREAATILEELAAAVPGWRPIGEAPKDGTEFLALQNGEPYLCKWSVERPDDRYSARKGWFDLPNQSFEEPTHFMPLPAPPSPQDDAKTKEQRG